MSTDTPAKSSTFEDAVLVRRAQSGDGRAFADLVRKYQDRVYNTCWRICGRHEDARDLTQDAFLKAYESIQGFRGRSAFYTWVFRIAVNLALNHRRRAGKRSPQSLSVVEYDVAAGNGALSGNRQDTPMQRMENEETHERLAAALETLHPDYRTVIVLRDIEGFDYQEIADILEVAIGTVRSRIHRGRMMLRKKLEGKL